MEFYSAHSDERLDNADLHFEDERPPLYPAEDYAEQLRKYGQCSGGLYKEDKKEVGGGEKGGGRNSRRRALEQGGDGFTEMGLRQFTTVSQLLVKLRTDLQVSYHSFTKEFISPPNDGVSLLLDLLKQVQLGVGGYYKLTL